MSQKRILFVDDESNVLHGLRRMLRPFRDKWQCDFAESGMQALEQMRNKPADVIVSDMMMPGMNGAELLEEIRRRHPTTVRMILSGHAHRDLVLKCVGCAHRFLAKPCDPDSLTAALTQATSISLTLENPKLAELVGTIDRLPSPPGFLVALEQQLASPDAAVEDIGSLIAKDVSMTAQLLKLVNSAFFGLPRRIVTPTEAVAYLGLDLVRALTVGFHLNEESKAMGVPTKFIEQLWQHSLRVSAGARLVAEEFQTEIPHLVQECSAAGLLHDLGKLIFSINFPSTVADAIHLATERRIPLREAELQFFGCTHAEVGGYLFALWGLPFPIVRAVAQHDSPRAEPGEMFSALTAVHLADVIAHELDPLWESGVPVGVDEDYFNTLGLSRRLPELRRKLEEEAKQTPD